LKNKHKSREEKEDEDDFTEEDVSVPLHTLVVDKRIAVNIWNMVNYADVFASIEGTVLAFWDEKHNIRDKDVLSTDTILLKDFEA